MPKDEMAPASSADDEVEGYALIRGPHGGVGPYNPLPPVLPIAPITPPKPIL
jgi:hypothetical protein